MSEQPNLWGYALQDAAEESPFDFMEGQGEELREQTNGLLWGEVSVFTQRNITYHEFRIASSRLEDCRCVLLRTAYGKHIYPLYIYDYTERDSIKKSNKTIKILPNSLVDEKIWESDMFLHMKNRLVEVENTEGDYIAAPTDDIAEDFSEFKEIFTRILQSKGTRAIIQSLLVQGNPSPAKSIK